MKHKSMQFSKHGSKFPYYGTSTGKHKQFSSPSLPYRFKFNEHSCNPKCLGMYEFP